MIRQLLAAPTWRRWTLASLLARIPISMSLLALMIASDELKGSVGLGAVLAGLMTFTAGLLGPWSGRLLDRRDLRRGLQARCVLLSLSLGCVAAGFGTDAPAVVLAAAAILVGVALAGLWGGFRALLLVVVDTGDLRRAHFVESLMIEVGYGVGPVLIGLLMARAGPTWGLAALALFPLAAAMLLELVPTLPPGRARARTALWRDPGLRFLFALAGTIGLCFGAVESNVASRMDEYGLPSNAGGWFLGILATGSCIGGLVASLRPVRTDDPVRTIGCLLLGFGAMVVPSTLAPGPVIFGLSLLFVSLLLVPLNGLCAAELEERGHRGQRAEIFAYLMAAMMVGSGLGNLLNGWLSGLADPRLPPRLAAGVLVVLGVAVLSSRAVGSARRSGGAGDPGPDVAVDPVAAPSVRRPTEREA